MSTFIHDVAVLIMQVIVPKMGGLLIYAEHRYFGQSVPYNTSNPWSPQHIGWCCRSFTLSIFSLSQVHIRSGSG